MNMRQKKYTEIRSWNPTARANATLPVILGFALLPTGESKTTGIALTTQMCQNCLLPSRLPPSPVPAPPSVTRLYWTRKRRFILPPIGRHGNAELHWLWFMVWFFLNQYTRWFKKDNKTRLPSKAIPPNVTFKAAKSYKVSTHMSLQKHWPHQPLPAAHWRSQQFRPAARSHAISKYLRIILLCLTFLTDSQFQGLC